MPTPQVSIQFNSYYDLRMFMRAINIDLYEVSFTNFTITCHCTEEHQELAFEKFNGKVINAMPETVLL